MRIPSWFSLKGSRESVQKMRGVTSPQDHHWASEPSTGWSHPGIERPGSPYSTPRTVHSTAAAIQRLSRLFSNDLPNAVRSLYYRSPASRAWLDSVCSPDVIRGGPGPDP